MSEKFDDRLDVIVRAHSVSCFPELSRAVFSLVCQNYQFLTVNVVTQRFSDREIDELGRYLQPILAIRPEIGFKVFNRSERKPEDARSFLLNLGIEHTDGRYIAFLDYDDTIYPEAYERLIEKCRSEACAIAFASIAVKHAEVFNDVVLVREKRAPWIGATLKDLMRENFCPLHSFVIDRSIVRSEDLWFSTEFTRLEDYHFLLRICSKYPSDFSLIGKFIGDYYWKNDGSNTTNVSGEMNENEMAWEKSRRALDTERKTLRISPGVQRHIGLKLVNPALTVDDLISMP